MSRPYLVQVEIHREPVKGGYIAHCQWYVKYPDGTMKPFTTDTWDGTAKIPRLNVR